MSSVGDVLLQLVVPRFWKSKKESAPYMLATNYRRTWGIAMLLLTLVSLVPLGVLTAIDYGLTAKAIRSENVLRTVRVTSNTRRTLGYFLEEHLDALHYIFNEGTITRLSDQEHLDRVLQNLKAGFGGLLDLGLLNSEGKQIAYSGPFELKGKSYGDQPWFQEVLQKGTNVSDVFLGYRGVPHMTIAVAATERNGRKYVLRATLDINRMVRNLSVLELGQGGDAFLVNRQGILQTPSRHYGEVFQKINLPIPEYSEHTSHFETSEGKDTKILVGYAFIPNSPFILYIVKPTYEVMRSWFALRAELGFFFAASIFVIVAVIYLLSTFMINRAYDADTRRQEVLLHMESTNQLASIGRLAAGVAHEINNPLAVINENAGLTKDLLIFDKKYNADERLLKLIDSVLNAVERCGRITKQLLGFARHIDLSYQPVDLHLLAEEVIGFLHKEAEYRNIRTTIEMEDDLPEITTDRGKLQQVFLNLVNNAFQAMHTGGHLTVRGYRREDGQVDICITDTGQGIPPENLERIFEPFFSTRKKEGGSGLGLAITFGLVHKLGGDISASSTPEEGTTFTVTLPLKGKMRDTNENSAG